MSPAVQILFTAAAIIWLASPAYVAGLHFRLKLDRRDQARRRAEQGREVNAEWLAILAATEPTPIYDALMCEQIEKAEGWSA